jgi:hypothetical protein
MILATIEAAAAVSTIAKPPTIKRTQSICVATTKDIKTASCAGLIKFSLTTLRLLLAI